MTEFQTRAFAIGVLDAEQEVFNSQAKEGGFYDKCGLDWMHEFAQWYRKGWDQTVIELAHYKAERRKY